MVRNVGGIDRLLRVVFGLALLAAVFVGPRTPWGWIGLLPLATALLGLCPAYIPFGVSSCRQGS